MKKTLRETASAKLDEALYDFLADCYAGEIPARATLCVASDGKFRLGYANPNDAEYIASAVRAAGDTDMEAEWRDADVRREYRGDARKFFRDCIDNDGADSYQDFFMEAEDAFDAIPDGYFDDEA